MTETTLRVKADAKAPLISRSKLQEIRDDIGDRFDDVVLVVSELTSNSVRHGKGDIEVAIRRGPNNIRIEVRDSGDCFSKDSPRGNGLGLKIIERIVDDWGIKVDGGCVVWAELSPEALR